MYIVTGATSGIGKAVCCELAKRNISCLAIGRNSKKLENVESDYRFICDLKNMKQIDDIFSYCEEKKLILQGVIHCAGLCPVQTIENIDETDMINTYSTNVFSFVELCKNFCLYSSIDINAKIIALSSITADRAYKNQLLYASSKAALNSVVKSMAQYGIDKGFTVNAIELGAVKTEMFDSLSPNMETIKKHYPLSVLRADEAAIIICDYLSNHFEKMTGSIIKIDSGFSVVH